MGGLLAARVLAEFFDGITVVERDVLPGGGKSRRGVPQGRHVHGMQAGGLPLMEELFPAFGPSWPRTVSARSTTSAGSASGSGVGC